MNEEFQCEACFHIGQLTIHGACEACGSQLVIPQELMAKPDLMKLKLCPATA